MYVTTTKVKQKWFLSFLFLIIQTKKTFTLKMHGILITGRYETSLRRSPLVLPIRIVNSYAPAVVSHHVAISSSLIPSSISIMPCWNLSPCSSLKSGDFSLTVLNTVSKFYCSIMEIIWIHSSWPFHQTKRNIWSSQTCSSQN